MKLSLRLITILCYFLPCTFFLITCGGIRMRFAYNQTEANKNILLDNESATKDVDTTQDNSIQLNDTTKSNLLQQSNSRDTTKITSDSIKKSTDYWDKIYRKIMMPTGSSLSAIGSILYYKNLTGQISIGVSLLISIILFLAFKFIKSKRTILYLLLISFLCLVIFIVDSFISNVTLLWGSWCILSFLIFQMMLEFKDQTKTKSD